jgi:hypothetical protein
LVADPPCDADTYAATRLALEALYPGLAEGGYLVLDDYHHPWLSQCRKAVDEFRAEHGIIEPIHQIDWNGAAGGARTNPSARSSQRQMPSTLSQPGRPLR